MNILRVKPDINDLRNYLFEAATANFGFSEELRKNLLETYFKNPSSINDCDFKTLDETTINSILENHDIMPEYLYYVVDNERNGLSTSAYYTDISGLNLDEGLVVFDAFRLQIYYLLKSNGHEIEGPCHDLDLGNDGLIMYRNSGGIPVFQMRKYDDYDSHQIGDISPFKDFPYNSGLCNLNFTDSLFLSDAGINDVNKNNREYILESVKKNGWSLKFASSELQDDEEIVTYACTTDPASFKFASERLKTNKELIIKLLIDHRHQTYIYPYLPSSLKKDKDISNLLAIMNGDFKDFTAFKSNEILFIYNRELILIGIKRNPDLFKSLPEQYRDDYQIALIAVKGFSGNFDFCTERIKSDQNLKTIAEETRISEDVMKNNDLPF